MTEISYLVGIVAGIVAGLILMWVVYISEVEENKDDK